MPRAKATGAGRTPVYYPLLDSLRALAVGAVLLYHFSRSVNNRLGLGSAGVQLFFVLSGFLITGLLLEARDRADSGRTTRGMEWRGFPIRRTLRIFPLYYGVIILGLVFNLEGVRANAAAVVSYHFYERPWQGLKRRWAPSPDSSTPPFRLESAPGGGRP